MAIQVNKIQSAIMEFPGGIEVNVTKYINLPITWESVLDETLGTARILMTDMRQEDFGVRIDCAFRVNIPLEIRFEGQETVIRMIVARDTAEMTRKDGHATWSHNVELVDEVKLLEQEPVDNLTFKNAILCPYAADIDATWYTKDSDGKYIFWSQAFEEAETNHWTQPTIKGLFQKGEILISDNASTFSTDKKYAQGTGNIYFGIISLVLIITKPNGERQNFSSLLNRTGSDKESPYIDTIHEIPFVLDGEYRLEFQIKWYSEINDISPKRYYSASVETWIYVGELGNATLQHYTIKRVIDRVLAVTPTRTINDVNKYVFHNNAEEYATEESPEFTFTGKHLFEVMLDIASYKKMFPALYKNEIYFRPFWNGITLTSDDLPPPTKAVLNSVIDQYCTALDSYVENMVCINDTNVGSVVEPYAGGYISARSSGGSAISETSAIIPTQSAIYQPIALNVGETDGVVVGDIQSYVYEQEDYEALTDAAAAYPLSKAYALKYTRFAKNYTELAHRIKTSDIIADALTKPALANIIGATTNGAVGYTGMNLKAYLSQFIGTGDDGADGITHFAGLLFQPTYIPIVNARVRQYKPMFRAEDYEATLFYNQQAEVVDSEAFGEHVKGLVQKLGNHTEIRVYRFEKVDDIPTVGTLIDEKSVYNVAMTIYENHVDATLCLVDYAELSTYIGVKNEIKTSDISSTKWCNRFINWEEFFVFVRESTLSWDELHLTVGDALSITPGGLIDVCSFTDKKPLTCASFATYNESGDWIASAFAPIKHLALGNSIYFQWEMLDNFAVGHQSERAPDGATDVWTGTQYDRAQRTVRYCDSLGRMEKITCFLLQSGPTWENSTFKIPKISVSINGDICTLFLSEPVGAYLGCKCYVEIKKINGESFNMYSYHTIAPYETYTFDLKSYNDGESFVEAKVTVDEDETKISLYTVQEKGAYMRTIAHSLPQKPSNLIFNPTPTFRLWDLLVKKDSAEALTFAMQYHFRQTWPEFIIGSGMSNFCSLIGGSCSQLQFFISSNFINRFERHVKLPETDDSVYKLLPDSPTFTVEENALRVRIELPASVNDTIEGKVAKSWGLVGKDRNGNWQLIFGENKNSKEMSSEFDTTIYLVARRKNNEPQSRV